MMSADSLIMVLINKVDSKIDPVSNEEVKLDDPITRFKKLLGNKNPPDAKSEAPDSLRAKYGVDVIRNGFWGSDDAKAANKERDIFKFPIPEKIPEFKFERFKVTVEDIMKFIFPSNLEHSNSTGRLDVLALYGPTVAYHSVDKCFCSKCVKIAKERLNETLNEQNLEETKRMGQTQGTLTLAKT
jgi:hypothetical protein